MSAAYQAELGIFGGSGFYQFLEGVQSIEMETPYGKPSAPVMLGEYKGRKLAFIPRHGQKHTLPPHKVPYRANLYALKELGITRVLSPCASGSLQPELQPGDFVLCDQFVDRTWGRVDTFYEGEPVTHVDMSTPYCPELRHTAIQVGRKMPFKVHEQGTVVIIQGPRFSTRAESEFYTKSGWHVINMTQYPEVILARELEMCFLNISLMTDYDVGLRDLRAPVTTQDILAMIQKNNERLKDYLFQLIEKIPTERKCSCGMALKNAQIILK